MVQQAADSSRKVTHTHEVLVKLEHVLSLLKDAETGQRGFLLTGDERYLEPYRTVEGEIWKETDSLTSLTSDNLDQQRSLRQLARLSHEKLDELQETITDIRQGRREAALQIVRSDRGKRTMDMIRVVVSQMESREWQLLDSRKLDAGNASRRNLWMVGGGLLLSLLALSALAVVIIRTMRPMSRGIRPEQGGGLWARAALRYVFALIMVALAILVRQWLINSYASMPLFITFYPTILFVASIAGGGPGILATLLSVLAVTYWYIPPYGSFAIGSPNDAIALGIFGGASLCLSILAERLHRATWAEAVSITQEQELELLDMGSLLALDLDRRILRWSEGCCRLYGFDSQEAKGQLVDELLQTSCPVPMKQILCDILERGYWEGEQTRSCKDGTELSLAILLALRRDGQGAPVAILEVSTDITRQKRAEAALREGEARLQIANESLLIANENLQAQSEELQSQSEELQSQGEELQAQYEEISELWEQSRVTEAALRANEERFRNMFERHKAIMLLVDPDNGAIIDANAAAAEFYGRSSEELRRMKIQSINLLPSGETAVLMREVLLEQRSHFIAPHQLVNGETRWVEVYSTPIVVQGKDLLFSIIHDISERKQAEEEREVSAEFLRIANESNGTEDLTRMATTFFQRLSGCEAVGIRLHDGDDYPYYEVSGFPQEFILAENSLCFRDPSGEILLDKAGNPVMDCMCGNVICRRFDPSKPFFTSNGSFWTNSTSELLSSTSEEDRQFRTRNRCHGEGYESVALIPLRLGETRMGLLQLNDRQGGRFSPEKIALWERLADYLAVALAKFRADEALQQSEEQFRTLANAIPQLCWIANADGWIIWYNHRWYEYTGTTPEQMEGWGWQSVHDPDVLPGVLERWKVSIDTGKSFDMVFPLLGADGVFRPFLTLVQPVYDQHGKVVRWFGTNTDISEQYRTEQNLREVNQRLDLLANASSRLLASDSPQDTVDILCQNLMALLDCQVYLNFLVDDEAGRLHINAFAGISEEEKQKIEWLDYDVSVCGCSARDACLVMVENIPETQDSRTDQLKSFGIQAYTCHPLIAQGRVLGTLSFGTRTRTTFTDNDLSLMKAVADQVAIAIERKRAEDELRRAHDDLERRIEARTAELRMTIDALRDEIVVREQAEANLMRLTRLYTVLSETNQAIVRANNRDSLFRDFCRIAVEEGGFLLAWIGLVDEGSGDVRRIAACGTAGYLDEIRISVYEEEPGGRGPAGLAIRRGTYYVCNDFQNDPCTRLWHDRARSHGINASASVVLKEEDRVIGVLTLYAGEMNFFDEQHEGLLVQMGLDISFALDNMAREVGRQKAEQALYEETRERLRVVESLRENEQMLLQQSRLAAMGEMINNIAHQWRQPLNVLGMLSQQMRLYYDLGSFNKEFLDTTVNKSMGLINHMSQTIDDFRNFFMPEKEKVEFAIHEVVSKTMTLVEDNFKNQQIGIDIQASANPTVTGFPNEFSQALLNILINAKDALAERRPQDAKVTVTIGMEGEKAVMTIADNAGGIPMEILGKIFEPYFTTKGPDRGTGVGLFMSKTIIEKNMNGRLTVCNTADGAEFKIVV